MAGFRSGFAPSLRASETASLRWARDGPTRVGPTGGDPARLGPPDRSGPAWIVGDSAGAAGCPPGHRSAPGEISLPQAPQSRTPAFFTVRLPLVSAWRPAPSHGTQNLPHRALRDPGPAENPGDGSDRHARPAASTPARDPQSRPMAPAGGNRPRPSSRIDSPHAEASQAWRGRKIGDGRRAGIAPCRETTLPSHEPRSPSEPDPPGIPSRGMRPWARARQAVP